MTPADRYLLNRLQEAIDILYLAGPHARASSDPSAAVVVKGASDNLQCLADQLQSDPEGDDDQDDTPLVLELGEPIATKSA